MGDGFIGGRAMSKPGEMAGGGNQSGRGFGGKLFSSFHWDGGPDWWWAWEAWWWEAHIQVQPGITGPRPWWEALSQVRPGIARPRPWWEALSQVRYPVIAGPDIWWG